MSDDDRFGWSGEQSAWVNEDGEVVHPMAPRGRGGPGRFRTEDTLGRDVDFGPPFSHPQSPDARYRVVSEAEKNALKGQLATKASPPPQNPPPVTVAETKTVRGVKVNILADATTTEGAAKANTPPDFHWTAPPGAAAAGPADDPDKRKITKLTGALPVITITIQTTYGPGTSATGTSGYGRGTTAADIASGDTSLGFHESCHRQDFLDFLRDNAPPVFAGHAGMTATQYRKAVEAYPVAVAEYKKKMEAYSVATTDEVGKTLTEYKAEKAKK